MMKMYMRMMAIVLFGTMIVSCGGVGVGTSPAPIKPTSITINPSAVNLILGFTKQFTATGTMSDGSPATLGIITWDSSSTTVASIDATGLASAVGIGTTNITATSGSVTSAAATLTVMGPFYVSTTGLDSNDGLFSSTPKLSIKAAITAASVGQAVLVSGGTYTVNSNAGAGNQIVLKEGVSLYGGYSADFATRNPAINITNITDTSTAVGTGTTSNRTIQADTGITAATVVDGFVVNGAAGVANSYTAAIYNSGGGAPTISHNTINGGGGGASSWGVLNFTSSPTITSNTINGGSGTTSGAIGNTNSSPIISNNVINGGSGTSRRGIASSSLSSPIISNNTIDGGSGTGQSCGVINDASSSTLINNIINGGKGGVVSIGVYDQGSSSPTISHNTINGGRGTSSYAVYDSNSSSALKNNILFTTAGTNRYCFYEANSTSDPAAFNNNDLFDATTALYYDEGTTSINTLAGINGLPDIASVGANVTADPLFANRGTGDYRLQSSSPVTQAGLDLTATIPADKDGVARTVPVSIGAYEQDY